MVKGNITTVTADAIVNAANASLAGRVGVDGAIHRAGGPAIMEACDRIRNTTGRCATGSAVLTIAGKLPARYVIHAVGPVWKGGTGGEAELLAGAYRSSVALVQKQRLTSVTFPNISTGVYGFPKLPAADIAIRTAKAWLLQDPYLRIIFVCFYDENYEVYKERLA